ncbi:hypothetical protein [Xanthomonas phage RTH11]|nr:hypothetical protein [Xanthomonas phage RTH11]
MPLRRFYLIADPMQTVHAESMAALHGGDSAVRKCLPAWAARAMSQGKLVEPCACCNKLTDMVTDQDPTVAIPRERFYSLYREITLTKH